MTDYPTRAEIDAAAETIEVLQTYVERGVPAWGVTFSGLETAIRILLNLDAIPGLHLPDPEPEPEPQPTAAEVLREACHATDFGTPERGITLAAMHYAEAHPEWFADWHSFGWTTSALLDAANKAEAAGDGTADLLLTTAAEVASQHPHLFGGAA